MPLEPQYSALQDDESYPVDDLIDRIPKIAALDRRILRLSNLWQSRVADQRAFIDFIDLRLARRLLRQEAYFDAGFARGRIAGRIDSLSAVTATPAHWDLARQIERAVTSTKLPHQLAIALVLEVCRAFVLGKPFGQRSSPKSRQPSRRNAR